MALERDCKQSCKSGFFLKLKLFFFIKSAGHTWALICMQESFVRLTLDNSSHLCNLPPIHNRTLRPLQQRRCHKLQVGVLRRGRKIKIYNFLLNEIPTHP
jgi:hypothetical protein